MRYCTIYIARHGQTTWNAKGKIQGQSNPRLTKKGIQQAQELSSVLKDISFDAIFSSDLVRAKRTAEIVAKEHDLVVTTTELMRELSFGIFEGVAYDVFSRTLQKEIMEFKKLTDDAKKFTFRFHASVETDEEVASRTIMFLREVALGYAGKTVLVVSHGAIMRVLMWKFGLGSYEELDWDKLYIHNGGYMKIESDGIDFYVREMHKVDGLRL